MTMSLDLSFHIPLPDFDLDTRHSFYPYPVLARSKVHRSLIGEPSLTPTSSNGQRILPSGSGPLSYRHAMADLSKERAARRALIGRRPAGVALGREAEELSDEEAALEDEKVCLSLLLGDESSQSSHAAIAKYQHVWPSFPPAFWQTTYPDGDGCCTRQSYASYSQMTDGRSSRQPHQSMNMRGRRTGI